MGVNELLPTCGTTKLPSPVKVCILSLPDVVIVPPVAVTKFSFSKLATFDSLVNNQPFVASM